MIKNGKLFGKINVIDLLALAAILAAALAIVFFFLKPKATNDTLVMKFLIEEVDSFVAEKVHVGDTLYDDTYVQELGFVTDVELDDSISYGLVEDGMYTLTSKEGYYSMIITGEVEGKKTKNGAEIGDKKYGVGHSMVLRAGDAKLYLRVYDIAVKNEDADSENKEQTAENVQVKLTFYAREVQDYVAQAAQAAYDDGASVTDVVRKSSFGTIDRITVAEARAYVETSEGYKESGRPGYNAVTIEVTAEGEMTENGVKIDGRVYSIGDSVNLRVGLAKISMNISAIEQ